MNARETRAGGRHIAHERGAQADEPHEAPKPIVERGTRLIDRLDGASLLEVCKILGITAAQLEERYGR